MADTLVSLPEGSIWARSVTSMLQEASSAASEDLITAFSAAGEFCRTREIFATREFFATRVFFLVVSRSRRASGELVDLWTHLSGTMPPYRTFKHRELANR